MCQDIWWHFVLENLAGNSGAGHDFDGDLQAPVKKLGCSPAPHMIKCCPSSYAVHGWLTVFFPHAQRAEAAAEAARAAAEQQDKHTQALGGLQAQVGLPLGVQ